VNHNKPINFAERKVCQAMPDKRPMLVRCISIGRCV